MTPQLALSGSTAIGAITRRRSGQRWPATTRPELKAELMKAGAQTDAQLIAPYAW